MRTNRNGVNLIIHFSTMMAFLLILIVITVAIDCFVPILQKGDFRGVAFDWISVAAAMSVPIVSFVFRKIYIKKHNDITLKNQLLFSAEAGIIWATFPTLIVVLGLFGGLIFYIANAELSFGFALKIVKHLLEGLLCYVGWFLLAAVPAFFGMFISGVTRNVNQRLQNRKIFAIVAEIAICLISFAAVFCFSYFGIDFMYENTTSYTGPIF